MRKRERQRERERLSVCELAYLSESVSHQCSAAATSETLSSFSSRTVPLLPRFTFKLKKSEKVFFKLKKKFTFKLPRLMYF